MYKEEVRFKDKGEKNSKELGVGMVIVSQLSKLVVCGVTQGVQD